ncbi:hypothetical protein MMC06_001793 [Schaereria dolodes]|nr:hypothetical protein [Schaereria dolodes]
MSAVRQICEVCRMEVAAVFGAHDHCNVHDTRPTQGAVLHDSSVEALIQGLLDRPNTEVPRWRKRSSSLQEFLIHKDHHESGRPRSRSDVAGKRIVRADIGPQFQSQTFIAHEQNMSITLSTCQPTNKAHSGLRTSTLILDLQSGSCERHSVEQKPILLRGEQTVFDKAKESSEQLQEDSQDSHIVEIIVKRLEKVDLRIRAIVGEEVTFLETEDTVNEIDSDLETTTGVSDGLSQITLSSQEGVDSQRAPQYQRISSPKAATMGVSVNEQAEADLSVDTQPIFHPISFDHSPRLFLDQHGHVKFMGQLSALEEVTQAKEKIADEFRNRLTNFKEILCAVVNSLGPESGEPRIHKTMEYVEDLVYLIKMEASLHRESGEVLDMEDEVICGAESIDELQSWSLNTYQRLRIAQQHRRAGTIQGLRILEDNDLCLDEDQMSSIRGTLLAEMKLAGR